MDGSKILLKLLLKALGIKDELVIGFDDHLERRRGKQIKAKGIYRDAVRSSDSFFVKASGLRWLSFMVLTEVPFAGKVWALPFLTVLCPSERHHRERGIRHRKLTDRARQAILRIWRWFPEKRLIFVGDSSYAAIDLLNAVREKVVMVTRLRLDAALYEPAQKLKKKAIGRPRKKGRRLPNLTEVLKNPNTAVIIRISIKSCEMAKARFTRLLKRAFAIFCLLVDGWQNGEILLPTN